MEEKSANFSYTGRYELHLFDENLKNYNRSILNFLLEHVSKPPVDHRRCIVDFGAGTGSIAKMLFAQTGIRPECIELDPKLASQLQSAGFHVSSSIIVRGSDPIDLIYSINVLEHLEDDVAALEHFFGGLRINGTLFLYVPALSFIWSEFDDFVEHKRRYSRRNLIQKVERVGFQVTCCRYSDFLGIFGSLLLRFLGKNYGLVVRNKRGLVMYDRVFYPISLLLDKLGFSYFGGKNLILTAVKMEERG